MKELNQRQLQALTTKHKITEAAMSLLKSTPYDNIKITDICRLAGISVGGFYHYFDSKEKIVIDAYNIIDLKVINKYNEKSYTSPVDSIIYLNRCIAMVTVELGSSLVSNCYRQLLVDDSNYTMSPDRLVHKKLSELVDTAVTLGYFKPDTNKQVVNEYISKLARGNIFDWCVKRGTIDIVTILERELKDLLSIFLN